MKTITNKFKIALAAVGLLAVGTVSAQQTTGNIVKQTESAPASEGTGSIRLIDNKGTIKYLQASNGITMLTNDNSGDVTTTTWQLGGTLTSNTYITANGVNQFNLDGLELVTDIATASINAGDGDISQDSGATTTGTGFTVLIREESNGQVKKMQLSNLLQVQSGQTVLSSTTTAAAIGANTVTGLPADHSKVSVYRNGAKLIANFDYQVAVDVLTLIDRSGETPPADWTLYPSVDVIEIHWVK